MKILTALLLAGLSFAATAQDTAVVEQTAEHAVAKQIKQDIAQIFKLDRDIITEQVRAGLNEDRQRIALQAVSRSRKTHDTPRIVMRNTSQNDQATPH